MVVGEIPSLADVVVVGGGPGGYTAALRAAAERRRVTLIERDRLGGTCLNVGCIPSKALIHVAEVASLPARSQAWGLMAKVSVDMTGVQSWIGGVVDRLRDDVRKALLAVGVTIIQGEARFTSERRIVVASEGGSDHIEFGQAIAAMGARPVELPLLPFDGRRVLDSTAALALDRVPSDVAVVGGGYIGVELGTALAKLGSRVTLVEESTRLLGGFPAALVKPVQVRLQQLGVRVELGALIQGLDGPDLVVGRPAGDVRVPAEVVVVAVGRRPNTDKMGLEQTGARLDGTRIRVDSTMRATRSLLAVGDVTSGPALAHKAMAEAETAGANATGRHLHFAPGVIPIVAFADPEILTVGATVEAARDQGVDARRVVMTLAGSPRALTLGDAFGRAELVVDEAGTLLGAHLVGPGVSELGGELALAVEMGASAEDLALISHPHPTLSEIVAQAAGRLIPRGPKGAADDPLRAPVAPMSQPTAPGKSRETPRPPGQGSTGSGRGHRASRHYEQEVQQ